MEKKKITVIVEKEVKDEVDFYTLLKGISITKLIKDALKEYFNLRDDREVGVGEALQLALHKQLSETFKKMFNEWNEEKFQIYNRILDSFIHRLEKNQLTKKQLSIVLEKAEKMKLLALKNMEEKEK